MDKRTVFEIDFSPSFDRLQVGTVVGIGAVLGSGKGVVEAASLDNHFNGGIVCPGER